MGYTEEGVASDLLAAGVPKEDIVLGFRHPKIRQHTGFAVA
ncbi:fdxN element excision controlling factor protein [Nostoc carneum NIES-2107]|nr:fdxN element excision controlling factor protein [Nostoc carneum NIES-2107]